MHAISKNWMFFHSFYIAIYNPTISQRSKLVNKKLSCRRETARQLHVFRLVNWSRNSLITADDVRLEYLKSYQQYQLRKCKCLQSAFRGHRSSIEVDDFGTIRGKGMCDFLLVIRRNLRHILHRFCNFFPTLLAFGVLSPWCSVWIEVRGETYHQETSHEAILQWILLDRSMNHYSASA